MPLSRRYMPEHPPEEVCRFGLDYSMILPVGVGIASGKLEIFLNNVLQTPGDNDWTAGPVSVQGRALYATLTGGQPGFDYQLRWTATDTDGNVWPRTTLVLCAETS